MKTFKKYVQENRMDDYNKSIEGMFDSIDDKLNPTMATKNSFVFGKKAEYEVYKDGGKTFVQLDKGNQSKTKEIKTASEIVDFIKHNK